jgi:tetratricopeptide (TPR) repeat protein
VRLAAIAAVGLWVSAGCRERATEQDEPLEAVEARPRIEVSVSGCSGLVQDAERGLVCLTRRAKEAKPLYLWLDGAHDPKAELRFSGVVIEPKHTVDPEGVMLSVELPEQQGRLELSTRDGVWSIELLPVTERFEALRKEVQASWKSGDAPAALERFERGMAELRDDEAALLACAVGKVVLAAGDHDRVLAIAKQVSGSSTISCVGKASLLAAYVHIYLRPDFNAAELSLQAAEAVRGVDLDTRIGAAYLRGVLEHWLGEIDESLVSFERATRLAWLVGDEDQHASALVMQAITLARLGRFEEAEGLAVEIENRAAEVVDPTLALDIRSTVAWIAVLRREDEPSLPDPTPALREMIAAYAARGNSHNLANRRLELALTAVQNLDPKGAAAELAAIDRSKLEPDLLVWFELASARIVSLRGEFAEAERHLDRAELLAELNQDRELDWRVAIARGELERARGRSDAALERFSEASKLADELAMSVAGDAGRSRFVTSHGRADVALVELQLEQGDNRAALCTAMAARARHLRGLWSRLRPPLSGASERRYRDLLSQHRERKQAIAEQLESSWTLSDAELELLREQLQAESVRADQLLAEATELLERGTPTWSCERMLPVRPGEAVLTMTPTSDRGIWTAMFAVQDSAGELLIEIKQVATVDGVEAAAEAILDAFARDFALARTVRVIPVGAFVGVEFHRLWLARGHHGPMIIYSLGLGAVAGDPRERSAAVVAGSSNLAAVSREATTVAERLRERGWAVDERWRWDAEQQPSLLHYAGHGFDGDGLGWGSAIELPGIGRVSAAQVVAGQRAPELVVLGACGAGRATSDSIDGGMNITAAFLLAGAQLVISPSHDVDDDAAYELALRLYRDFDRPDAEMLIRALAEGQREQLEGTKAHAGSESFNLWRAWTP